MTGGPLMVEGVQVGIVSWSIKPCTVPPYPGVFTNVAFYIGEFNINTQLLDSFTSHKLDN